MNPAVAPPLQLPRRPVGGGGAAAAPGGGLGEPNVHRFPIGDNSRLGMLAFLVQHDSYHVGQAAFLRRQIREPAMAYLRGSKPGATAAPA